MKTPTTRSELMKRVRRSSTQAELIVRNVVRNSGYRFSTQGKGLPGTPDIVHRKNRWAIFVNGCFWHRHEGCPRATAPKSNKKFWEEKFHANRERDFRKSRQLEMMGFRILVVWECETADTDKLKRKICDFMRSVTKIVSSKNKNHYYSNSIGRIDTISSVDENDSNYETTVPENEQDHRWLRVKRAENNDGNEKIITAIDLFSGCGGLSFGLLEACRRLRRRLEIMLAVDLDSEALSVFKTNLSPQKTYNQDIRNLIRFDGSLKVPVGKTSRSILLDTGREIDILVAGPPCQGFSDLNNHTRRSDDRNDLYLYVARAVQILRPKVVVIENVPAVRLDNNATVRKTIDVLMGLQYNVDAQVVDFTTIGIPQTRKRHVILAVASKRISMGDVVKKYTVQNKRSVAWAIEDLESIRNGNLFDSVTKLSRENVERIDYLFEHDLYDLPNPMRPRCHRDNDHSYKSMYGRLRWDRPAQTITGGFSSPGQGRFIHPRLKRTITPHEAARLQFFPDFFDFSSVETRSGLAKMIGNAVPMKLSFILMTELLKNCCL